MFGKFMNKKFFHPGSYPNIRRKWIAEQKALAKEKTEQEMKEQYQKEQTTYQNKLLITKKEEDKIKLGLNFMYELPPGMKQDDGKKEEGDEEVKFEWQKKAPRAGYTKNLGLDVHDQPFGVCVRNVKCFRCGKWGHQNVDKECPLYNEKKETGSASVLDSMYLSDPLRLISDMRREHGLTLRKSVIGREIDPMAENQQILDSDDENSDVDVAFIESLSDKQKRKLLKKLEKMEKRQEKRQKLKLKKMSKKEHCFRGTREDAKRKKRLREDEFDSKRQNKQHDEEHMMSKFDGRNESIKDFPHNSVKKETAEKNSRHSDGRRKRKYSDSVSHTNDTCRLEIRSKKPRNSKMGQNHKRQDKKQKDETACNNNKKHR